MLIQNAIKIFENPNDPIFIKSQHTHDYVTYIFKDGKTISVDGGPSYIRRGGNADSFLYEDWSLEDTDPFILIKSRLLWGTYGKDGKGPLKYVALKDCDTDHLKNIKKDLTEKSKQFSRFKLYVKVVNSILKDRKK